MESHHPSPLLVPVRATPSGVCTLRTFRLPDGARCAVAFSSEEIARRTMGPAQELVELSLPTLRAMLAPLGATRVQVDPDLVAPAVGHGRVA